jgi:quercetin dioxygenase-like cupin family protein
MKNDNHELSKDVLDALLAGTPPLTPPPGLKAKVMARAGFSMPANQSITARVTDGWLRVSDLLEIKLLFVDEKADSVSFLLKGQAGAAVPSHIHSHYEECLVLEGDVQIGDYLSLGPGDFHCAGPHQPHPVVSTRHGTLVYLRTAIKDSPIPLR